MGHHFSTKPLTTRNSLTGEDVGGMREREARNAEQIKKKEKAGSGKQRSVFVVLSEENMKTAEDCLYPVDGGSLHSLIWLCLGASTAANGQQLLHSFFAQPSSKYCLMETQREDSEIICWRVCLTHTLAATTRQLSFVALAGRLC